MMDFLLKDDSEELFAEVDYLLKDGVHIQGSGRQVRQFNYIRANEEPLKLYYSRLFRVNLSSGGDNGENYYFLDFFGSSRGNIPEGNRHTLKSEFVIIGFIIYKIFIIDREVELSSVQKLKEKIRIGYDDYKPGIYSLIAKSKNTSPGNINDEILDNTVQAALNEFRKIGWITMDKDEFDLLPAFDRLPTVYEKYINDLSATLKRLQ